MHANLQFLLKNFMEGIDFPHFQCYNETMEEKTNKKIYPTVGKLSKRYTKSSFAQAANWQNANTSFYWVNFEYPQYHGHTDWELVIVLNDQILHKINGTEKLLTVGTACLIGPKDSHALFYPDRQKNQFQAVTITARDSYVKELLTLFSPTLYEALCAEKAPLYFSLSPTSLEKYANMLLNIQTYRNESTPQMEEQCNIIFSSLVLAFLEQRQHDVSGMPGALKDFIRQLNNPLITTAQIKAAQLEMPYSYPQLTRIFKKYMHCTITQYVNKTKLQYAKELLVNTDMSLSEITSELHFESTSHFHSLFRKHFDITPAEYRRLNRGPRGRSKYGQ